VIQANVAENAILNQKEKNTMKALPAVVFTVFLSGVMLQARAQTSGVKPGKGTAKPDQYMTNELYQTKPPTAESKGEKEGGKKPGHNIGRIKTGQQKNSGTRIGIEAKHDQNYESKIGSQSGVTGQTQLMTTRPGKQKGAGRRTGSRTESTRKGK
jgi:hypothetical protein